MEVGHLLSAASPTCPAPFLILTRTQPESTWVSVGWEALASWEACWIAPEAGLARRLCDAERYMLCDTGLLISCLTFLRFRPQDELMEEEEPMNQ